MKRSQKLALAGASISGLAIQAHAAVPTEVSTKLGELAADMTTVGTALVIAAGTAVIFKWIKGAVFG